MFIDTHCHISEDDYDDIDLVIEHNKASGVDKMIVSGCEEKTINEAIELSKKYNSIYVTIGYHPDQVEVVDDKLLYKLELLLNTPKVVGIGEIGLDYHYGKENRDAQINLFRKQMKIAEKYHLPVVIHSRDATEDTISVLKEFPSVIGDIHCFSGSIETAKIYISLGYKIGIGGVVTFKNSKLYKVVETIGITSILLETDAPYLAPVPFRGKINSSKYLPYIAKKVADTLNLSIDEVAKETSLNAIRLFDLKTNL